MSAASRESGSDGATIEDVRVGVDVGGTFTDAVILTAENRLAIRKVPTTPSTTGAAGSLGLLGTFVTSIRPWRTETTSVNVPPTSTPSISR